MFKRLWGKIKNFIENTEVGNFLEDNAGKIIGSVFGGPLGLLIGVVVDQWVFKSFDEAPPHLLPQLHKWSDTVLQPLIEKTILDIGNATASQLVQTQLIDKFNSNLKKLATLKAYYEFQKLKASTPDEIALNKVKIDLIKESVPLLIEAYTKAIENVHSPYFKKQISFRPTDYTRVGLEQLNWSGAKEITGTYVGYAKATTIIIPPPTSPGTATPGTTLTPATKPAPSSPTPVDEMPTTGGTAKPTSGGTVKPTTGGTTKPGNDEVATTTAPAKSNKKYWLIGAAVVAAGLYLKSQSEQ